MPHPRGRICAHLPVLVFILTAAQALGQSPGDPAREEVPYGAASNWVAGTRLLAEGDVKGALQHLHLAYRLEPDEPLVALAFQEALAARNLTVVVRRDRGRDISAACGQLAAQGGPGDPRRAATPLTAAPTAR